MCHGDIITRVTWDYPGVTFASRFPWSISMKKAPQSPCYRGRLCSAVMTRFMQPLGSSQICHLSLFPGTLRTFVLCQCGVWYDHMTYSGQGNVRKSDWSFQGEVSGESRCFLSLCKLVKLLENVLFSALEVLKLPTVLSRLQKGASVVNGQSSASILPSTFSAMLAEPWLE